MEEHSPRIISRPSVENFQVLAKGGKWDEFDRLASLVCNDPTFLRWTSVGLVSSNLHDRDLAITLLENTTSALFNRRKRALVKTRDQDEDAHLKRKAAIALFKHGDKTSATLDTLREALMNDPELKDRVGKLLEVTE